MCEVTRREDAAAATARTRGALVANDDGAIGARARLRPSSLSLVLSPPCHTHTLTACVRLHAGEQRLRRLSEPAGTAARTAGTKHPAPVEKGEGKRWAPNAALKGRRSQTQSEAGGRLRGVAADAREPGKRDRGSRNCVCGRGAARALPRPCVCVAPRVAARLPHWQCRPQCACWPLKNWASRHTTPPKTTHRQNQTRDAPRRRRGRQPSRQHGPGQRPLGRGDKWGHSRNKGEWEIGEPQPPCETKIEK